MPSYPAMKIDAETQRRRGTAANNMCFSASLCLCVKANLSNL
jgi:hypothetical protein